MSSIFKTGKKLAPVLFILLGAMWVFSTPANLFSCSYILLLTACWVTWNYSELRTISCSKSGNELSAISYVVIFIFSDDADDFDYDAEAVFKLLCNYIFYILFTCALFFTLLIMTNAFNDYKLFQIKAILFFTITNYCYLFILQNYSFVINIVLKIICAHIVALLLFVFVGILVMVY